MKSTLIEYVSNQGYSKDESERLIRAGQVMVNRIVIFTPSEKLNGNEKIDINIKVNESQEEH